MARHSLLFCPAHNMVKVPNDRAIEHHTRHIAEPCLEGWTDQVWHISAVIAYGWNNIWWWRPSEMAWPGGNNRIPCEGEAVLSDCSVRGDKSDCWMLNVEWAAWIVFALRRKCVFCDLSFSSPFPISRPCSSHFTSLQCPGTSSSCYSLHISYSSTLRALFSHLYGSLTIHPLYILYICH